MSNEVIVRINGIRKTFSINEKGYTREFLPAEFGLEIFGKGLIIYTKQADMEEIVPFSVNQVYKDCISLQIHDPMMSYSEETKAIIAEQSPNWWGRNGPLDKFRDQLSESSSPSYHWGDTPKPSTVFPANQYYDPNYKPPLWELASNQCRMHDECLDFEAGKILKCIPVGDSLFIHSNKLGISQHRLTLYNPDGSIKHQEITTWRQKE